MRRAVKLFDSNLDWILKIPDLCPDLILNRSQIIPNFSLLFFASRVLPLKISQNGSTDIS